MAKKPWPPTNDTAPSKKGGKPTKPTKGMAPPFGKK